jgi:DNA-binding winged helix-turn-helix (wHTH) protein
MQRAGRIYDFGQFRMDTSERVLFCVDKPLDLRPKTFEVLQVLVQNAGHVVEKEELMRLCWPDTCVEDNNLAQCISALRRVLGQNHERDEWIQTIHRRGYRFLAAVHAEGISAKAILPSDLVFRPEPAEVDLTSEPKNAPGEDSTERVHHLCFRGRYYWRKYTVEGLNEGIDYFRRAIKIDPDYAPAYAGLGDCYYRLANIQLPPKEAMPKAKGAVMTALKIDDKLAEAHALLGLIMLFYGRNWPRAETEFRKAIELAPGSALAHKRFGWALGMLGRFDQAISEFRRVGDLGPVSADIHVGLGFVLHLARRYAAAVTQAQIALDLEPEFFPARLLLAIAHIQQGLLNRGIAELQKAASHADVPLTLGHLGYAYGVSGNRAAALQILTRLKSRLQRGYVSPYAIALVHTGLSQKEQALRALRKTCEDRNEIVGFIKTSPELDSLRSDERFAALVRHEHAL